MRRSLLLVHGAWHDASYFSPLVHALEQRGTVAVAMDLPGHGARRGEVATMTRYVEAIVGALEQFALPPIVVGHSMAGIAVTAAAEVAAARVGALVYLCAFLPVDGETFMDLARRTPPIEGAEIDPEAGTVIIPPAVGERVFYHDCPDAARWAAGLQPQALAPSFEPVRLTAEGAGRVPRVYVRCLNDRVILPSLQAEMAARAEPILRVDLACGHSPFLACPDELADVLVDASSAIFAGP